MPATKMEPAGLCVFVCVVPIIIKEEVIINLKESWGAWEEFEKEWKVCEYSRH